jgi:hypothetical protein
VLEQDEGGPQPVGELEAVLGAGGAPDRDEARLGPQQHGEAGTHGGLGVDDEDAGHALDPSNRG